VAVDRVVIVWGAVLLVGVPGVICGRARHRCSLARYGLRGLVAGVVFPALVIVVVFHCCPPVGECSLAASAELSSGRELDYLRLRLYPAAVTASRTAASVWGPETLRREVPPATSSTAADVTPSSAVTAFSTVWTQCPHVRPVTE
jgi:hypothetical protein